MMADYAVMDFNSSKMLTHVASDAINEAIDNALLKKQAGKERREYLGASAIGKSCERALQYEYAGAPQESGFKPNTLRKFDFGHMGEELMRSWFWDAGFDLVQRSQRTGQPYRFAQADGRFAGTPDGVFIGGPDVIKYPALWEAKSVGAKTFREIAKHGLKKARPTYYAQVAVYAAYLDLMENPSVFSVLNLDSGEILHLLIPFDAEEAQRMSDRAVRIIQATEAEELLPRPFADSSYFECAWCAFKQRCWA